MDEATLKSNYIINLIEKGRIDYIENKGKEPNNCVLRPEQYYQIDFIKDFKGCNFKYMGMDLHCSTYIEKNTMIFYFQDSWIGITKEQDEANQKEWQCK